MFLLVKSLFRYLERFFCKKVKLFFTFRKNRLLLQGKTVANMGQTKRHVVSYERMSEEVSAAFAVKYPRGFEDYFPDLVKYTKPDGTPFYAVTIEIAEDIYLVKIQVKTDDLDDVEKWLEGEEDAENEQVAGTTGDSDASDNTLPDDNISQYGGDDDSSDA